MRRRLVDSRSAAQRAIAAGRVLVGGVAEPKASTMVAPEDPLHLAPADEPYVGRGGVKLAAALDAFSLAVADRHAVDVGASTGGFTDCLLQRGARSVTAVDVGYGQIHWRIRNDPRVRVVERTNIRFADPAALGAPFDVIVADLSFISLRTVAPQLAVLGHGDADWIVLVKPQFEVGRGRVPPGGVVRDAAAHHDAVAGVLEAFAAEGVGGRGLIVSPITGSSGNVEFLAWLRGGTGSVGDDEIRRVVGGGR